MQALNHLRVPAPQFDDRPNQFVQLRWERLIDGLLPRIVSAGAELTAFERYDLNPFSSRQQFYVLQTLLVPEHDDLGHSRSADMHQRLAGRRNHVVAKFLVQRLAACRWITRIANTHGAESTIPGFHADHVQ